MWRIPGAQAHGFPASEPYEAGKTPGMDTMGEPPGEATGATLAAKLAANRALWPFGLAQKPVPGAPNGTADLTTQANGLIADDDDDDDEELAQSKQAEDPGGHGAT